jgi:uncharacterized membrane protein
METKLPDVATKKKTKGITISDRIAEVITAFAGSMAFVYLHIVIFAVWTATGLFGLDPYPYNFLTMMVSLEAIFLSTFVMIAQNRQAAMAELKSERDYQIEYDELTRNSGVNNQILNLAGKTHALTKKIHRLHKELNEHIKNTQ